MTFLVYTESAFGVSVDIACHASKELNNIHCVGFTTCVPVKEKGLLSGQRSKLGFYVPFNSQTF